MKSQAYKIIRYDAEDGMAFDWATPRYVEDENGNQIAEHLYAKTLFIGEHDHIMNYIEVKQPQEVTE